MMELFLGDLEEEQVLRSRGVKMFWPQRTQQQLQESGCLFET